MSVGAKVLPIDRDRFRYKMKDLSDATGLDRQAIHFYIQQGLLPPGHKTGRNMAWYTEEHLERLRLIKKLQHERFLPLKAIKALLDGREELFAPEQQRFLHNVREKIDASLSSRGPVERVSVHDIARRPGVDMDDIEQAETLGLATIVREGSEASISAAEAWLFDALGELRVLGFTKERGFTVADVAFYHEAMSGLFRQEIGLLSSRLSHLEPVEAARMIERAIPIVNQTLSRLHTQLVREFFGDSFLIPSAPSSTRSAMDMNKLLNILPNNVRHRVEPYFDAAEVLTAVKDPRVMASLGPAGVRGLLLQRGKQGVPTLIQAHHEAFFDWTYPSDQPEMQDLYRRAKLGQWNGDTYLPWHTDVDPENPEVPIVPKHFLNIAKLRDFGIKLTDKEESRLTYDMVAWMLSQFLHGEQGALLAAAQVTEAVQFFDGKLYGATQVMDEARHVEVFHRYLDTKMNKLYQINDNLFVIIDALMGDSRWDMKFLGMQIMVEGLALGAFGTLYSLTKEPLLKELLKMVIQDEARHVHYGVVALREHFNTQLSPRERNEREDWSFEVALLMRNRFLAWEVYEEWFEGRLTRSQWKEVATTSPGLEEFRHVMFSRMVPNLREIGLLSDRIKPHYEQVGLNKYFGGKSADEITGDEMIDELDSAGVQHHAAMSAA